MPRAVSAARGLSLWNLNFSLFLCILLHDEKGAWHMKRVRIILIACILCFGMAGCKSADAKSVDGLIEAIGSVDSSSGSVLAYVREAYEMLSPEDQASLDHYGLLLSAEAAYADACVAAVGEVTLNSESAIAAAEAAYASLTEEAKAMVAKAEQLHMARQEYDLLAMRNRLSGVWVNEVSGPCTSSVAVIGRGLVGSYGLDETNCNPSAVKTAEDENGQTIAVDNKRFELRDNGTVYYDSAELGQWRVSDDQTSVLLRVQYSDGQEAEYTLQILEEGGFTKLVGSLFENEPFGYVREQDYVAAFYSKFAVAELSPENIHDYVGDPVFLGKLTDSNGKKQNAYVYPSQVYRDGNVYLGSSCMIQVDYIHGGKEYHLWLDVPVMSITKLKMTEISINTESRLSGEIYYVKDEYVSRNYINEAGLRVLELTNGVQLVFDRYGETLNTFWNRVDASYSDHLY